MVALLVIRVVILGEREGMRKGNGTEAAGARQFGQLGLLDHRACQFSSSLKQRGDFWNTAASSSHGSSDAHSCVRFPMLGSLCFPKMLGSGKGMKLS